MISKTYFPGDLFVTNLNGQVDYINKNSWGYITFSFYNVRVDVPKGTLMLLMGFRLESPERSNIMFLTGNIIVARSTFDFLTRVSLYNENDLYSRS
jgi:hypothetical protein